MCQHSLPPSPLNQTPYSPTQISLRHHSTPTAADCLSQDTCNKRTCAARILTSQAALSSLAPSHHDITATPLSRDVANLMLMRALGGQSDLCTAGSSLLGRAKQLGPHSFVNLSLFPANDQLELAVPPLQTSFQAQTFCPEFHFRRQLPLQVDARLIRELSTQVSRNERLESVSLNRTMQKDVEAMLLRQGVFRPDSEEGSPKLSLKALCNKSKASTSFCITVLYISNVFNTS